MFLIKVYKKKNNNIIYSYDTLKIIKKKNNELICCLIEYDNISIYAPIIILKNTKKIKFCNNKYILSTSDYLLTNLYLYKCNNIWIIKK